MGPPTAAANKIVNPATAGASGQPMYGGFNSASQQQQQQPQQPQQQQRINQNSQVFYQDPEHAELEFNRGLRTAPQQQQFNNNNNNNNDNNFNRVNSQYNHLPQTSAMHQPNMMYGGGNSGGGPNNAGGYQMSSNQNNNNNRRMM